MGHRGHDVVLETIEFLQACIGVLQLRSGLFERVRICAYLRSLVEDVENFRQAERLFLDHRCHHHARRGAADGAGELGFDHMHQFGLAFGLIAPGVFACVLREDLRRTRGADEACQQAFEVFGVCAAAPQHCRTTAGRFEDIDEQAGLGDLVAIRLAQQRDTDIEHHVHQQAPQQRVREVIQPAEAKQRLGAQPFDAPQPVVKKAPIEPARLGERGQQQGV